MPRGYQTLEELEEQHVPASSIRRGEKKGKELSLLLVVAALVLAVGGALIYASKMRDYADAMKALADSAKHDGLALHQQIKMLEGERETLTTKVDDLSTRLKGVEEEKGRLMQEIESLKKPPAKPAPRKTGQTRKRA